MDYPKSLNLYDDSNNKQFDVRIDNNYTHLHTYNNRQFHIANDLNIPTKYENETGFINVAEELNILKKMIQNQTEPEPEPEPQPEPEPEPESNFINLSNSSTSFTKAYRFDGINDFGLHTTISSLFSPLAISGNYNYDVNVAENKTATTGTPWHISMIIKLIGSSGTVFRQSNGDSRIQFYLQNNKLKFHIGTSYNYLLFTSTDNFTGWHGIYIDYNGGSLGSSSGDINKYYSRYRFKKINLQTGVVEDINGNWTNGNYGFNGIINGYFYLGKNKNIDYLNFEIACLTINTLPLATDLLSDNEINKYVMDPQLYKNQLTLWRQPGTVYGNVPLTTQNAHYGNKLYLFGNTSYYNVDTGSNVKNVYKIDDYNTSLSLSVNSNHLVDTFLYPIN